MAADPVSGNAKSLFEWMVTAGAPVVAFVVFESIAVLSIALSAEDGKPVYNSASLVLVAEAIKLCVALRGVSQIPGGFGLLLSRSTMEWVSFSVPALLYAINNNIFVTILSEVPPAAFQLFMQLRVIWTGLLFRCILNRFLSRRQWFAVVGLTVGAASTFWASLEATHGQVEMPWEETSEEQHLDAVAAMAGRDTHGAGDREAAIERLGGQLTDSNLSSGDEGHVRVMTPTALLVTLLYSVISCLAGVFTERLLKTGDKRSIHLTNAPMYVWGVMFNVIGLAMQARSNVASAAVGAAEPGLLVGWDRPSTWFVAAVQAFVGLLISLVIKKFDNIVKIFCVTTSNAIVYVASVLYLGVPPSLTFVASAVLITYSAYVYSTSAVTTAADPKRDDDASRNVSTTSAAGATAGSEDKV